MLLSSALALLAVGSPAPMAIVAHVISGPEGTLTAIQASVLAASAYRRDFTPMRDDESFSRAELGARIEDCADDDRCVAERLKTIGARYGLVIVVNAERDFLGVELIDAEAARTLGQDLASFPKEPLADVLRARVAELFDRAGFAESARLTLRVAPPGAEVTLDGPVPRVLGGDVDALLDPGPTRVSIALDGHLTQVLELTLERGKTASRSVELVRDESLWSSPWLWLGAAGAVTAGVVTAVVIATAPGPGCVCLANPGELCPSVCP